MVKAKKTMYEQSGITNKATDNLKQNQNKYWS